jgi:hypothetical protein
VASHRSRAPVEHGLAISREVFFQQAAIENDVDALAVAPSSSRAVIVTAYDPGICWGTLNDPEYVVLPDIEAEPLPPGPDHDADTDWIAPSSVAAADTVTARGGRQAGHVDGLTAARDTLGG